MIAAVVGEEAMLINLAVKRLVRVACGVDISLEEGWKKASVVWKSESFNSVIEITYGTLSVSFTGDNAMARIYEIGREERAEVAAADGIVAPVAEGWL